MTFGLSVVVFSTILRVGYLINYKLHTALKFGKLIRDNEWIT